MKASWQCCCSQVIATRQHCSNVCFEELRITVIPTLYSPYSFDYNTPYIVALGQGRIIAGMDRGLVDMCLWERRRITIPPHLGYGARGVGSIIPPHATLVFYVRLIKIERVSPMK